MNAIDLLRAMRHELHEVVPSLTLNKDEALVVGLCGRSGSGRPRFLNATLDPSDLDREPATIAAEIAAGWRVDTEGQS